MLEEYFKAQKKEAVDEKKNSGYVFPKRKQILSHVLDQKFRNFNIIIL
jgi:hypothetical protein